MKMGISKYVQSEWRLFIDSSKQNSKCLLLDNGNKYESIPKMIEEQKSIAQVL